VLDRMSALSQTEINAIEAFVDGLVATGDWDQIYDLWSFALNGSDYLTGWKAQNLTASGTPTHTPGTSIAFNAGSDYLRSAFTPADVETWNASGAAVGGWVLSNTHTGTGNHDLCGAVGTGLDFYWRWRGTDTNDVQAILGSDSGTSPRLSNVTAQVGFFFASSNATTRFIRLGDSTASGAQTIAAAWSTSAYQINGRNSSGTPQNGQACEMDFHFVGSESLNDNNIKAAIEQFRLDLAT
jgi:hypothetical protein